MRNSLAAWCGTLLLLSSSVAGAAGIQGDYVEARTADVFTGPCISNAEVFIYGNQAVMAWKVNQGAWKGPTSAASASPRRSAARRPSPRTSPRRPAVLIVDAKANASQREALVQMARELGGARLKNIVAVKATTDEPEARRARRRPRPTPPTAPTPCPTPPGPRSGPPASPRSSPGRSTTTTTSAATRSSPTRPSRRA